MIEYFILFLVIFTFILASYEDIKKREVYDYLNFLFVFLIIIFTIFDSIISNSLIPIKYVGFGLILGFTIGSILYYIGIWGGGDAKFLIGFCGSIYYIKDFSTNTFGIEYIYFNIVNSISYIFSIFISTFLNFILILDFIFMLGILVMFFIYPLKKKQKKNLLYLFLVYFILFIGLYFKYNTTILILLGVFGFILIFFAEEDIFNSVYIKIKKKISNLKEYDVLDLEIKVNNKTIISEEESNMGLTKENLIHIFEKVDKNLKVDVRKILPYSILIGLNYIIYVINIISLDDINLDILSFIIQFMFYSFIIGGIISLLIIFYYYLKNYKSTGIIFLKKEKIFLYSFSILILIFSIIYIKVIILMMIIFFYLLLKIAKKVEKHIFVEKKNIEKIVPGDWIVQDIKIDGKLVYSIENFKLGVSEEQIKKLKQFSKTNEELKEIYVKDGLAFLPPLFLGFLIMIFL